MEREVYIRAVTTILPLKPEGFLVYYGRSGGRDIDLFGVVKDNVQLFWELEPIDLFVISLRKCEKLVELLDPKVIEPIRTGKFIAGSRRSFQRFQRLLHRCAPTDTAISHLMRTGVEQLFNARKWLEHYILSKDVTCARNSLIALGYSYTYILSARYYAAGNKAIVQFQNLLSHNPTLETVYDTLDTVKKDNAIDPEQMNSLIGNWEMELATL